MYRYNPLKGYRLFACAMVWQYLIVYLPKIRFNDDSVFKAGC